MLDEINKNKFYYYDPLLRMDSFSRFLAKLIIIVSYIFFSGASLLLIFGDTGNFKYLGVLILIILVNRFIYRKSSVKKFDYFFRRKLKGKRTFLNSFFKISSSRFSQAEPAYDEGEREGGVFDKINLFYYTTDEFKKILRAGLGNAILRNQSLELAVLAEFLNLKKFRLIFKKLDIDLMKFASFLQKELEKKAGEPEGRKKEKNKERKKEIISKAEELAINSLNFFSQNFIQVKDLFLAVFFSGNNSLEAMMNYFKFSQEDIKIASVFLEQKKLFAGLKRAPLTLGSFAISAPLGKQRIMNRAWTARPTPYLDSIGIDLTNLAKAEQVGLMVGHEREKTQIQNILARPSKNNALLIGDPGSGKETIVMNLAYNIVRDNVLPELFDKRLVMLSVSRLIAGGDTGEIMERTKKVVLEILNAKNIILYVPDFDNLTQSSGAGYLSAADALLPSLSRGDFQLIASVTPQDFKRDIEPKTDLAATFENIKVEEISEEEAIRVLGYISLVLENNYRVNISYKAIKRAVKVSRQYFRERLLPAGAEELLKESLAYIRSLGDDDLNEEDVVAVAQMKINIPLTEARENEAEKLLNLEDLIHQRLVGQDEAVKAVSQALREYRAGLSRQGGPIAAFLFAGPTGVGKTELSKILAEIQFGSKESMVRFDMSEYQNKASIFRFVGSPEGEIPGALTEAVRQKPFSLILLDEFEKAHPDLLNVFLSVFDDGRLTDNAGRTVDFSNTIIIATSNAHSNLIKEGIEKGKSIAEISEQLKKNLTDYFKPELINRFSKIVAFRPLTPGEVKQITVFMLSDLAKVLEQNQGIFLRFGESAIDRLVETGFSLVYGARPMRNAISDNIKNILADKILRRQISRGDNILVSFKKDKFVAEKID